MSLTKQQLLEAAKPRFEWVEVPVYGKVGVRSLSMLRRSQRESSYRDSSGALIPEEIGRADLHQLVDQIMVDESTPMFTDEDLPLLEELDSQKLVPLYEAIRKFGGPAGNGLAASSG